MSANNTIPTEPQNETEIVNHKDNHCSVDYNPHQIAVDFAEYCTPRVEKLNKTLQRFMVNLFRNGRVSREDTEVGNTAIKTQYNKIQGK